MAILLPFQGLRYDPNQIKDPLKVVCPPYDVIDTKSQDRYYQNHEKNIIRVELGKDQADDSALSNRYTRAAAFLKDWMKQKVLVRDPQPSFYLYKMDYNLPGKEKKVLKGFFALVQLEDVGKGQIFPHEFTFPSAKQDRLHLLRACHANTSPIFMLYSDPGAEILRNLEGSVDEVHPLLDFVGEEEVRHRLWRVSAPSVLVTVGQALKDRPLFIADGHHRYETALSFRDEMRARSESRGGTEQPPAKSEEGPGPYDSVFVFCSNMDDPGVSLLPIHRVIQNPLPADLKSIRQRISQSFEVEHLKFNNTNETQVRKRLFSEMRALGRAGTVFGMYANGEPVYHLLKLKPVVAARAVDALDVAIFQKMVLEGALGIGDSAAKKESLVHFVKDEEAALKSINSGAAGMVFFLNPTRIDQVREVVLSGDRMPQKSTYFYPKPLTGLVINKF